MDSEATRRRPRPTPSHNGFTDCHRSSAGAHWASALSRLPYLGPVDIAARLDGLAHRVPDELSATFPRGDSAVLLLVVNGLDGAAANDERGIVLTRRSSDLRTDPGFVAFPGGRIDEGETPEQAARRECEEEVGIPGGEITIHGRLDQVWNGAGFRIIPVVASIPGPVTLTPREAEVSAAAVVPLGAVADDAHHHTLSVDIDGYDFRDDIIEFESGDGAGWRLYGPTADIARDLAVWLQGGDRRQNSRRQAELDHFASLRWID